MPLRTSRVSLNVNGRTYPLDVDPATPLLYVLSDDLALNGPKFGCGLAQCGSCTVLVNGRAVRSCVTPIEALGEGDAIITLEGLGSAEALHPIQQAFLDEQAMQCGFCLSGVVLTAKALLDERPDASDDEIREALSSVLCRCGVHVRMLAAVRRYRSEKQKTKN